MANTDSAEKTTLATTGAQLNPGAGVGKLRVKFDTFTYVTQPAADTSRIVASANFGNYIGRLDMPGRMILICRHPGQSYFGIRFGVYGIAGVTRQVDCRGKSFKYVSALADIFP